MNDNERIAAWMGWKLGEAYGYQPDIDILRWHGKDALLQKIKDKRLGLHFCIELSKIIEAQDGWGMIELDDAMLFMMATPAQLTAALVAVIEEA